MVPGSKFRVPGSGLRPWFYEEGIDVGSEILIIKQYIIINNGYKDSQTKIRDYWQQSRS